MRARAVGIERLLPPQVRLHRLAAALVGFEHDVVGLVPDASRALFERTAGVRPRARAALEHADLLVAEARERRRGERGGDAVLARGRSRSEEHTSELQSRLHLVCRLLLEK